jgi:hypothetical protein
VLRDFIARIGGPVRAPQPMQTSWHCPNFRGFCPNVQIVARWSDGNDVETRKCFAYFSYMYGLKMLVQMVTLVA